MEKMAEGAGEAERTDAEESESEGKADSGSAVQLSAPAAEVEAGQFETTMMKDTTSASRARKRTWKRAESEKEKCSPLRIYKDPD